MTGFIVRRLLSSVLVVILTSMFVFVLFFKGLGDSPARQLLREARPRHAAHPSKLASIKHQMGFDKSAGLQLRASGRRASSSAATTSTCDGKLYDCPAPCLGISITTGNPVWTDLKQKYPATLTLAVGGATIYLTLGVFLGAMAARWRGIVGRPTPRGRHADRLVHPVLRDRAAGVDLPLPPAADLPEHRVLPDHRESSQDGLLHDAAVAGDRPDQLHVRTPGSRAARWWRPSTRTTCAPPRPRACRRNRVLFKHALRAAIVPVITIFGLDFATLLGGTIFTEQIFSIDGIGHWGLQALHDPDRHQRHQRHRAGRRGADRGRQPGRRRLLRLPRPAGHRRLTAGDGSPAYTVTRHRTVTPLSVVVSRLDTTRSHSRTSVTTR